MHIFTIQVTDDTEVCREESGSPPTQRRWYTRMTFVSCLWWRPESILHSSSLSQTNSLSVVKKRQMTRLFIHLVGRIASSLLLELLNTHLSACAHTSWTDDCVGVGYRRYFSPSLSLFQSIRRQATCSETPDLLASLIDVKMLMTSWTFWRVDNVHIFEITQDAQSNRICMTHAEEIRDISRCRRWQMIQWKEEKKEQHSSVWWR